MGDWCFKLHETGISAGLLRRPVELLELRVPQDLARRTDKTVKVHCCRVQKCDCCRLLGRALSRQGWRIDWNGAAVERIRRERFNANQVSECTFVE